MRIYDYNYKVGESYYNPQTDYIGSKPLSRTSTSEKPPEAQTYAERFASSPIYGHTRGLPYDESQSVFRQPMASLSTGTRSRASSLSREPGKRGSSVSRDPEPDVPSYGSRRRSLFDEDFDYAPSKPIKKYSFDNSFQEPIKSSDLKDKLRKISDDYNKPPKWQPPRNFEKREVTFRKEYGPLGQPIIKREELTYSIPDTSKSYRKSSIVESSSSYDSKPPLSLRTRRSSIGTGDELSSSISSIRRRKFSEDASSGLSPRPSRYLDSSRCEDTSSKFGSANQFREARKIKESEELTDHIQKMVNKMKSHHLDDASADIRGYSHTLRATSLDPIEDDGHRSRSRQRARLNQFTYGVGKY